MNSPIVDETGLFIPPYNADAEASVLGGIFLDNLAYDKLVGLISEVDFYIHDHKKIFSAQAHLLDAGKPADIITVAEYLESHGQLTDLGQAHMTGLAYLGELTQNTPSAANIERYAEIVRDHSLLRLMATFSSEISEKIHRRSGLSAKELLDFAQSRWMSIGESMAKANHSMLPVREVMNTVLAQLDHLFNNPNPSDITGLPSGLIDLDKMTTGFQPGELIIVAGRPSMGKTSFALNIVEHVALHEKKNVAFFSLEMINAQLGVRLLSSVAKINQQRVKVARLSEDEWVNIADAAEVLRGSNIYLDEESSLSVNELRARARRLHRECAGGLHLIVVDYIGLMELSANTDNRAIGVAEISRALKLLAKELHVPVIALSQLNRGLESRPNKRPIMSDLRDSGGIEQDADTILFIYRDEVYNEDTPDKGIAEVIVGKQRNGPIGTVTTAFIGHLMRFENLATGYIIPSREIRMNKQKSRGDFRGKNHPSETED